MEALAEAAKASTTRTGETLGLPTLYPVSDPQPVETVHSVKETEYEPQTQLRFNRWLGSLATERGVAVVPNPETTTPDTNLLESIQLAKEASSGSPEAIDALNMVSANIATAVAEACFKDNHISTSVMRRSPSGELVQHGQTNESIRRNAMTLRPDRHPILQDITRVEVLNSHRIEDALDAGMLKDHYFVAFSVVPDGVPEDELGHKGDGYFLDGLTYVAQATTEHGDGEVVTKTGFMEGVEPEQNDTFEERIAKRHDIATIGAVYKKFGLKAPTTASEILENGLYIPKNLIPNGMADVMKLCAEAKDEILGRDIARRQDEFVGLELVSKRREASLADVRQKVLDDLLSSADQLADPMDAVRQMWKLIKKHTTENAFTNHHIDPKVFGRAAAPYIIAARHHIENGREDLAQTLKQKAHEKSTVGGCGGGASSLTNESSNGDSSSEESSSGASDKFGSLKFKCPKGHVNTRPRNKLIPHCKTCGVSVKC